MTIKELYELAKLRKAENAEILIYDVIGDIMYDNIQETDITIHSGITIIEVNNKQGVDLNVII